MSNLVRRGLSFASQQTLHESEPVQAKNVGLIRAWTFDRTVGAAGSQPERSG